MIAPCSSDIMSQWRSTPEYDLATLRSDPLVEGFRELIPEGTIGGGSFAHWLPPRLDTPRRERGALLGRARRKATTIALANILSSIGLPATEPRSLPSGGRAWPVGFTGSVSHRGSKVVAVIVSTDYAKSVGIDMESYRGAHDLLAVDGLADTDELPTDAGPEGAVILFSAKEAVFKAVYPVVGVCVGFSDVTVSWSEVSGQKLAGTARCLDMVLELRCQIAVPGFVGSIALPRS